jgi:hypothetical protein
MPRSEMRSSGRLAALSVPVTNEGLTPAVIAIIFDNASD